MRNKLFIFAMSFSIYSLFLNINCNQQTPPPRNLVNKCDSLNTLFYQTFDYGDFVKLLQIYTQLNSNSCDTFPQFSSYDLKYKEALDSMRAIDDRAQIIKRRIRSKYNEFDQITWIDHQSNPKFVNRDGFYLYFGIANGEPQALRLKIQYYADDWLFVRSYDFLIDGKLYHYYPEIIERNNDSWVWEWMDEPLNWGSYNIVREIINSKSAKIRFNGERGNVTRTITKAEKMAMAEIIDYFRHLHGTMSLE